MNSQTKRSVMELPEQLKTFIANEDWIFAKTYAATWPHEYIVQERVDNDLFLELANYINQFGYEDYFYEMKLIYFKHNELTYWHMGNIINRCMEKDNYRYRKAAGNLPKK